MLKKILVAGFMVAAKDVICCKHINWLFHYQPLLAYVHLYSLKVLQLDLLSGEPHSKFTGYPRSFHSL